MTDEHEILYVTPFRRRARKVERELQAGLDEMIAAGISVPVMPDEKFAIPLVGAPAIRVPGWTRGVRVERAGPFSHAVVATPERGH